MGEDPTRLRAETRERIGFMPQNVALYDDLTVAENLDFVGSLFGLFRPTRRRRIRAILEWLELEDARSRRAEQLSGGMRRRLQLGCALIHDPQLVFLDEPTSGIDPIVRRAIWAELHRLRDAGRTLIVTTQIVTEAEECDTVALIAAGRLIACASPEDLRREAFGGELLEVETSGMVDAERLQRLPGIDGVRQLTPRLIRSSPGTPRAPPRPWSPPSRRRASPSRPSRRCGHRSTRCSCGSWSAPTVRRRPAGDGGHPAYRDARRRPGPGVAAGTARATAARPASQPACRSEVA